MSLLYVIKDWSEHFENNRSRTVSSLSWVAIPNRHDGENFTSIITHPEGSKIFSAWILMLQVASKCDPRGTLIRDNKTPHTPLSLSLKTRAPQEWFEKAIDYLVENTDWLDYQQVAGDCQATDTRLTGDCASRARAEGNGKDGKDGTEGKGTGDHRRAAELWCKAFKERFGAAYSFNGSRDGKAIKTLLSAGLTPEDLAKLATTAWSKTDPKTHWNCCNRSKSLAGFAEKLNEINSELANQIGFVFEAKSIQEKIDVKSL